MNGRRYFWWSFTLLLCAAAGLENRSVQGQTAPDPPATRQGMEIRGPDAAQQPALPSIVQEKRAFYVQGVVVAALFGGAIWAVCHSSRRV